MCLYSTGTFEMQQQLTTISYYTQQHRKFNQKSKMSTEQLTSFKVFTLFKHGKFSTAVVSHTKIYSLRRLFSWLIKSDG